MTRGAMAGFGMGYGVTGAATLNAQQAFISGGIGTLAGAAGGGLYSATAGMGMVTAMTVSGFGGGFVGGFAGGLAAGQSLGSAFGTGLYSGMVGGAVGFGLGSVTSALGALSGALGRTAPEAEQAPMAQANFEVYEVLSEQPACGMTRAAQRVAANDALYSQLQTDPELARMFNERLGADVLAHMESGTSTNLLNPPGTVWHHPIDNPNVVQLMSATEHTDPLLQPVLHPGGIGGYGTYYGN